MKNRLPAAERRKQILKCAVRVFARSNYRGAKMTDIAAEAGISEAMIYKHFPSKKSIFMEILEHISERILIFWQEEVEKERHVPEALTNMGIIYYQRMIKHPDELKVQFQAISEADDKEIGARLQSDHEGYMRFIREVLHKGIEQGSIRKDTDVDALVILINGAGVLMNMMKILSFEEDLTERRVVKLIDHLIGSIRA